MFEQSKRGQQKTRLNYSNGFVSDIKLRHNIFTSLECKYENDDVNFFVS